MSSQRRGNLPAVAAGVVAGAAVVRGRRRGVQCRMGHRTVPPVATRSLRWVRGVLPGDEGTAWWAEVTPASLLLVGVLAAVLVFAGWLGGGALAVGSLTTLLISRHRPKRRG
ncbi:MAG: hypothetical protein ACRDSR_05015 [Pseudonocardiaceae bacterium]